LLVEGKLRAEHVKTYRSRYELLALSNAQPCLCRALSKDKPGSETAEAKGMLIEIFFDEAEVGEGR
jgi:hypothetical protein